MNVYVFIFDLVYWSYISDSNPRFVFSAIQIKLEKTSYIR